MTVVRQLGFMGGYTVPGTDVSSLSTGWDRGTAPHNMRRGHGLDIRIGSDRRVTVILMSPLGVKSRPTRMKKLYGSPLYLSGIATVCRASDSHRFMFLRRSLENEYCGTHCILR